MTLLVRSPAPAPLNNLVVIENALRCCSLISSAFCGSGVCDYVGRAVLSSSLRSRPSPRTCVGLQSLSPGHHRRSMHVLRNQWRQNVSAEAILPPSKGRLIGSRSRKRGKRLALTIADFCNKIGTLRHFAALQ